MSVVKNREDCIRLGALKVRYRQAWKRQASSCELAALLSDIEKLESAPPADAGDAMLLTRERHTHNPSH